MCDHGCMSERKQVNIQGRNAWSSWGRLTVADGYQVRHELLLVLLNSMLATLLAAVKHRTAAFKFMDASGHSMSQHCNNGHFHLDRLVFTCAFEQLCTTCPRRSRRDGRQQTQDDCPWKCATWTWQCMDCTTVWEKKGGGVWAWSKRTLNAPVACHPMSLPTPMTDYFIS